jgi:hypothetical protein
MLIPKIFVQVILLTVLVYSTGAAVSQDTVWEDIWRRPEKVRAVCMNGKGDIFAGTDKGVWKRAFQSRTWRLTLKVGAVNKIIKRPPDNHQDLEEIYVLANDGLYVSLDSGNTWRRIFKNKNKFEKGVTALIWFQNNMYLGNQDGCFESKDKGLNWERIKVGAGDPAVMDITAGYKNENRIFVIGPEGVFKSENAGDSWKRTFFSVFSEENAEDLLGQERGVQLKLQDIEQHPYINSRLYLATSKGIFISSDFGESWSNMAEHGLLSRNIKSLYISESGVIYCLSSSGLFRFVDQHWQEVSLLVSAGEFNDVFFDKDYTIYLATDKGLFLLSRTALSSELPLGSLNHYSINEPAIKEVQQAAISYAEVQPEKILAWRRQARNKAFLPQVSISANRDTGDLWHWESGSTTKASDDELRRGKDSLDCGITVSWDLGEIIWSNDQVSIDNRSRLMVELREDVLDEVTKLYFERLRRKMELNSLKIEEVRKRLDKELGIQELTAQIDALTGGYFSSHIKS